MRFLHFFFLAFAVFAAIAECSVGSAMAQAVKTVPNQYEPGGFESGMVVLVRKTDYANRDELSQKLNTLFDRLIDDHVNAVSIVWLIFTGKVDASAVWKDFDTPDDDDIAFILKTAKSRGFLTTARPIIDERSLMAAGAGDWRGTLRPADVNAWFKSYSALLSEYAELAQESGADVMIVGTELNSLEKYTAKWREVIGAVRQRFSGTLSYSSNQGISTSMPWDLLDYVGIDAFFELQTPPTNATAEDMAAWSKTWVTWMDNWLKNHLPAFRDKVVLTEVGSQSQTNAHKKSWLWNHGGQVDLEDQRRFYQAICEAWKPRVNGIYWWVAELDLPPDPLLDGDFSPLGKPAEEEMRKCLNQDLF
jgi:hypothetical protein